MVQCVALLRQIYNEKTLAIFIYVWPCIHGTAGGYIERCDLEMQSDPTVLPQVKLNWSHGITPSKVILAASFHSWLEPRPHFGKPAVINWITIAPTEFWRLQRRCTGKLYKAASIFFWFCCCCCFCSCSCCLLLLLLLLLLPEVLWYADNAESGCLLFSPCCDFPNKLFSSSPNLILFVKSTSMLKLVLEERGHWETGSRFATTWSRCTPMILVKTSSQWVLMSPSFGGARFSPVQVAGEFDDGEQCSAR